MDLAEAKRALRRELLARRRAIPPREREAAGRAVAAHVLGIPAIRRASRVALYAATRDELPTRPLFEALAATGCRRLLPRIAGDRLEFARVGSWSELAAGRFGVLAPPADAPAEHLEEGDVALLPGVAFCAAGQRLGRGGGYYDRTFAVPGPLLLGVAFHAQLLPRVPHGSRDRPVDAIVTERGVHWVPGRT